MFNVFYLLFRIGWLIFTRYLKLELEAENDKLKENIINENQQKQKQQQKQPQKLQKQQQQQPQGLSFAGSAHLAYTPVALILLKGILDFSNSQFSNNSSWLVPILSQLILCNDVNIRFCVSNIYSKHINPTALEAFHK